MRLHRLTMSAIGPYAGTEVIDFDRFEASGRFLLTGPTGAGKSTIIDAVVFALYGGVAGDKDSSNDRIRSRLAPPRVESFVELDFSTSAGRFRVRRSPSYLRPKLRGTGTTEQKASVVLSRITDAQSERVEPMTTRADDVGREIARLVGLSRQQFTQTVVLPQGQFATFLRASSLERHNLLRDVFGTTLYDDIQAELKQRAAEANARTAQARADLAQCLQAWHDSLVTLARATAPTTSSGHVEQVATGPDDATRAHAEDLPAERTATTAQDLQRGEPARPDQPSPDHGAAPAPLEALIEHLARLQESGCSSEDLASARSRSDHVLAAHEAASQEQCERSERERTAAAAALEAEHRLAQLLDRRRAALATAARLADTRPAADRDKQELAAAERAALVVPAALGATRSRTHAHELLAAAQHAVDALPPQVSETDDAPPLATVISSLQAQLDALSEPDAPVDPAASASARQAHAWLAHHETMCRDEAASLTELAHLESALAEREQETTRLDERLSALDTEIAARAGEVEALPARQRELTERLQRCQRAEAALPGLRLERDACADRLHAVLALPQASAALEQAGAALAAAAEESRLAKDAEKDIHDRWLRTTAANLVGELQPGQPCPVCGSATHPQPAPAPDHPVTREDLRGAQERSQAADHAVDEARTLQLNAHSAHERLTGAAAGRDREGAEREHAQAVAAYDAAQADAARLTTISAQLGQLDAEATAAAQALSHARTQRSACEAELRTRRDSLSADRARVEAARAGAGSVRERAEDARRRAEATHAAAAALNRAVDALAEAHAASTSLVGSLREHGFDSHGHWLEARRPEERVSELRASLAARNAQELRNREDLTDPDIAHLNGDEPCDTEAARARLDRADARWKTCLEAHSTLVAHTAAVRHQAEAVTSAAAHLDATVGDSQALLRVAALSQGENLEQTPLAIWVLSERFRDVLAFANERLSHVSDGRYELIQTDDEKQASRRRGLGLAVIDHEQDSVQRDARTLSGGETFYVSLSLALALADVVTAESGGITMETLFIDEGFGTLDAERLQAVLAELNQIQQGGRTVGIVSHVDELRRQVPDQIRVRRTEHGSTLEVTAP